MSRNNSLIEIAEFLKGQQTLTLLCHARPDGDTLGCAFGLKAVLETMGKEVQVLCADSVSPRYRFLSGGKEELCGEPKGAIVCVDMASPEMAGDYNELALRADAVIDHHATNQGYGKLNFIDGSAAAAGEIFLDLAKLLGGLTKEAAVYFYTAISTDTGCFKYGNTTARTHRAAAELAECGIDLAGLNRWLFQTKRKAEFELNRLAMEQIRYHEEGKIITMQITRGMLEQSGAGADELEVISALPIQIEGAVAAATFKELSDGSYKVSLRTDGSVHGGEVCGLFGGGGHRQASGCTMHGPYEELEKQMVSALKKALETV
ncbi:MAG: bifunctional oligoribonuclease/PAP phosphatase NrnA [Clostridia bacterium]|nr:bifunctional oligoribonuclease/PAP phosphatase NrnA [Clostridia bacterium]